MRRFLRLVTRIPLKNSAILGALALSGYFMAQQMDSPSTIQDRAPAGNNSEYSFGGGCTSQGSWTRQALSQIESIRTTLSSLQKVEACEGAIKNALGQLNRAETQLQAANAGPSSDEISKAFSLSYELRSLRSFADASTSHKNEIIELLVNKTMDAAAMVTGADASSPTQEGSPKKPNFSIPAFDRAKQIRELYNRTRETVSQGADAAASLFSLLPQIETCMVGRTDLTAMAGANLFAAATNLAASFVGGRDNTLSKIGNVLGNFSLYVRNSKFSNAFRKLDNLRFWTSMSCLLEATQQNFCTGQDSQELLQMFNEDSELRKEQAEKAKAAGESFVDPLEGYYLLINRVPVVTEWVQQVMFGSDPRFSLEANYQTGILKNVNDLIMTEKIVKGMIGNYSQAKDSWTDEAKKNALVTLVSSVSIALGGGGGAFGPSAASQEPNFIGNSVQLALLPYYLVGYKSMTAIPKNARSSQLGGLIPIENWANGSFARGFGNEPGEGDNVTLGWQGNFASLTPEQFLKMFETNVDEVLAMAKDASIKYFTKMLITDKSLIVLKSLTSPVANVPESLQAILKYHKNLKGRILNGQLPKPGVSSKFTLAALSETEIAITNVLESYKNLDKILTKYETEFTSSDYSKMTQEQRSAAILEIQKAYEEIVSAAYDSFNVRLLRDIFIPSRTFQAVQYDYSMRARMKDSGLNESLRQLMIASGSQLVQKFYGIVTPENDPTAVKEDLAGGQDANRTALSTLEDFFKDSMIALLRDRKAMADNKAPTNLDYNMETWKDSVRDKSGGVINPDNKLYDRTFGALERFFLRAHEVFRIAPPAPMSLGHADRYAMRTGPDNTTGLDDKFQSYKGIHAKLCIQTLAFRDRSVFAKSCEGAVMKAFGSKDGKLGDFDVSYDEVKKATPRDPVRLELDPSQPRKIYTNGVCALRDFFRANRVKYMVEHIKELR